MPAASIHQTDDRGGNAYSIATVNHNSGTVSTFDVDQSANSVCHSPSAGQANLTTESTPTLTPTTGISILGVAGLFGLKRVSIGDSVALGTYEIVVRHQGSAAGIGSNVSATDDGT